MKDERGTSAFAFFSPFILHPSSFLFLFGLLYTHTAFAQHTKHEIAFSFAYSGQLPIVKADGNTQGFYTSPLIASLRYQVATDFVQSLSVTLEHFTESRDRTDLWPNYSSNMGGAYNGYIAERLSMTVLGLEGVRTLVSQNDFRLGAGFGIGYGLGGASARVTKLSDTNKAVKTFESSDIWNGFEVQAFLRGVYTVMKTESTDLGIFLNIRYWGLPSIGPLSTTSSSYNGPGLRSLHEVGYTLGVAFGF